MISEGYNGVFRTFSHAGSRHYDVTFGLMVPAEFIYAFLHTESISYEFYRNWLKNNEDAENAHMKILNRK